MKQLLANKHSFESKSKLLFITELLLGDGVKGLKIVKS